MKISVEHFSGKYPSFNVALATAEGKEPFIVIKGCRIVPGNKGDFVSWPARKQDDGKWWNHVYASEGFAQAVMDEAKKSMPVRARDDAARARQTADDDSIPF